MTKQTNTVKDLRVLVMAERWVLLGNYHAATKAAPAYLTDAACIRTWGTTAGLGEIALKGPTPNTKLDHCGTVVLEPHAVLFSLKCTYESTN